MISRALFFLCLLFSFSIKADDGEMFVQIARYQKLAQTRQWKTLLHFNDDKQESTIDSFDFFISENGKTNPDAELSATLRAFFKKIQNPDEHAFCRYPARFRFLNDSLKLPAFISEMKCPERDDFLQKHTPDFVSLFYADASLKHPESFFGHLFLRLNKGKDNSETLSFSAVVPAKDDFSVFYKGFVGKYQGKAFLQSYLETFRHYHAVENRDLWEYSLTTSPYQNKMLSEHLWELHHGGTDFYFLTDNCALMTAELLDVLFPTDFVSRKSVSPIKTVTPLTVLRGMRQNFPDKISDIQHIPSKNRQNAFFPSDNTRSPFISPDKAHSSFAVDIAGGIRERHSFVSFGIHPVFHEKNSPVYGYPSFSDLSVLSAEIRDYTKENRLRFNQLQLIKATLLEPIDQQNLHLSFLIDIGMDDYRHPEKEKYGYTGYTDFGMGLSFPVWEKSLFYLKGKGKIRFGGYLPDNVMAGWGGKTGFITVYDSFSLTATLERILFTDKTANETCYETKGTFSLSEKTQFFLRYKMTDTHQNDEHDFMGGFRFFF